MGIGTRQTYYFKNLPGLKKLAEEEHEEVNGSTFEDLYWKSRIGDDPQYSRFIIYLYTEARTFRECLRDMVQTMAYSPSYMSETNIEFVKVVRSAIGNSDWIESEKEETYHPGDYRLNSRKRYIDGVFDIYQNIIRGINDNIEILENSPILKNNGYEPWTLPVGDDRYKKILTESSNYTEEAIGKFQYQYDTIEKELATNITPGQALDLIMANWNYLWQFSVTYEAIEYCIVLSNTLTDNPLIRKQLRNFCQQISLEKKLIDYCTKVALNNEVKEATSEILSDYAKRLKGETK